MRCALDYDENKLFTEQNVNAWGELQSVKEEPAYKEEDIKDRYDKGFFRGYKAALDQIRTELDLLVEDGLSATEIFDEVQIYMDGDLCMLLFSILDEQLCREEKEEQ